MAIRFLTIISCISVLGACVHAGTYYDSLPPQQKVNEVQADLKTLGYYDGDVDGIYGTQTAEAISAFQRDRGLTVDGKVGKSVYIQSGLAVTEMKQGRLKLAQAPATKPAAATTRRDAATPSQLTTGAPCTGADWAGTVRNIADLFECDTARAIETLSSGRTVQFQVGSVAYADSKYIAKMSAIPSYAQAAAAANSRKGNFSWANYFDTVSGYGSPYTVVCIFGSGRGASLTQGAVITVRAKLNTYSNRTATLTCS
jgi:hypothetical protein